MNKRKIKPEYALRDICEKYPQIKLSDVEAFAPVFYPIARIEADMQEMKSLVERIGAFAEGLPQMEAVAGLTEGNRLVGIISHVAELKERIDNQIVVTTVKSGGSKATVVIP